MGKEGNFTTLEQQLDHLKGMVLSFHLKVVVWIFKEVHISVVGMDRTTDQIQWNTR